MSFWKTLVVTVVCFLAGIGMGLGAFYDLMVAIPMRLTLGLWGLVLSVLFVWLGVRGIRICLSTYRYRNKW